MDIQDILAKNLTKYRKQAGYSQEQLAAKAELHRTYIGRIEQRRINVSVKNLQKIACVLNIKPYELLVPEN